MRSCKSPLESMRMPSIQNVIAGLQLPLLRRGSWQHAIDGRDVVAEHVANAEESVVGLRALHIAGHDAIRRAVRTVIESATCIAISVVARASPDATPAIVQTTATVPRPRLRSFGSNASRRRTGVPRDDGSGFISGSGVLSTDISISSLMVLSFSMRRALLECHREIREVFVRNRPRTRPRKIVEHQPAWNRSTRWDGPVDASAGGSPSPAWRCCFWWQARMPTCASREGQDLGDNIARMLNKRMRGRIEIGSVEWNPTALKKVITGGFVPVRIRNVKVWDDCALSSDLAPLDERRRGDPAEDCTPDTKPDPDPTSKRKPRKLLIDAPLVTAEIDVHAAAFGHHDLIFRNVHVHGGTALLEQAREPYPLHAYDRTIVSIITAFYPRLPPGFRAGIYAADSPPKFDLRDIHVHDVNVIVQFAPKPNKDGSVGYALTGLITGVNVDAMALPGAPPKSYLHVNADDPLGLKMYVRLGVDSKHASLRILDEGPRDAFVIPTTLGADWAKGRKARYQIELSKLTINRLAQLPDQWGKHDYVANNLEIDVSARTIPCKASPAPAEAADLHLTGQLLEWFDRPYDGKWDLQLAVKNLGPTLRTHQVDDRRRQPQRHRAALGAVHRRSEGHARSRRPRLRRAAQERSRSAGNARRSARRDRSGQRARLDRSHHGAHSRRQGARRGDGRVTFQLRPWRVRASVDIIKPIDIARFLPPKAKPVGKFLQGKLTAEGDSELGFELKDFDLALGRTEKEKSIRVYKGRLFTDNNFQVIKIQKVAIEAGRSRATFDGWVDTVKTEDNIDLEIRGCFPDLGMWLRRFELPVFAESACGSGAPDPGGGVAFVNAGPGGGGGSAQGDGSGSTTVKIKGNYKNPTIKVQTTLAGVPCMDKLALNVTLANGVATIHRITSGGFGGSISGAGQLTMPEGGTPHRSAAHRRQTPRRREAVRAQGPHQGTIDTIEVDVKSTSIVQNRAPADWLASFAIRAQAKVNVVGENYSNVIACINRNDDNKCRPGWAEKRLGPTAKDSCETAKKNGGFCAVVAADRDVGGRFAATIADAGHAQRQGEARTAPRRHDRARRPAARRSRSAHRQGHDRRPRLGDDQPRRRSQRAIGRARQHAQPHARVVFSRVHRRHAARRHSDDVWQGPGGSHLRLCDGEPAPHRRDHRHCEAVSGGRGVQRPSRRGRSLRRPEQDPRPLSDRASVGIGRGHAAHGAVTVQGQRRSPKRGSSCARSRRSSITARATAAACRSTSRWSRARRTAPRCRCA